LKNRVYVQAAKRLVVLRLWCVAVLLVLANSAHAYWIEAFAGNGLAGNTGNGTPATTASIRTPRGIAVGPTGNVFFADVDSHTIRVVYASDGVISSVAGSGVYGFSGDGDRAVNARLWKPTDVAVDGAGNLYIADSVNNRIRKVTIADGWISTVAGDGAAGYSGDGGEATMASLNLPYGVVVDTAGNLFIADALNHCVRKVDAITRRITTIAGMGVLGYSGDGGPATAAQLNFPTDVALDGAGNLYIADSSNHRIRKVDAVTGVITTVAGNGIGDYAGDGGPSTAASLYVPTDIALDSAGNLLIADSNNLRIRVVYTPTGLISTVAGNGSIGYSGDGGLAVLASLYTPTGVAVDGAGRVLVSDTMHLRVRRLLTAAPSSDLQAVPALSVWMAVLSAVLLAASAWFVFLWVRGTATP